MINEKMIIEDLGLKLRFEKGEGYFSQELLAFLYGW